MSLFSQSARMVLEERYLRRGKHRPAETPSEMVRRVASAVADAAGQFGEVRGFWEERFAARMEKLEFLPNSPTLMNAGTSNGQLAACFVLPLHDDLESIFHTLGLAARIQQSGGGTGFSFSSLRPAGDLVRSTGGVSSGPVSFIELFDRTTDVIRCGGRRRGANMAVLRVDHPDIQEFIDVKRAGSRLPNFNLSVGTTEAFFQALERGEPFALRNPRTAQPVREIDPAALLERMAEGAWSGGDPGLLFLDQIARFHVTPALGAIEATNPCGEQPLLPFESCILGSLNIARFAARDGNLEWERFGEAIREAVTFLDNVIEVNSYPSWEIEQATRRTRKIGLGIMGWADFLAAAGIPYDAPQATALAERVAEFLTHEAREESIRLAERRGSFPAFADSVWPARGLRALRNATVTCIAPTGTISLLAGCSSGIEPFFALATRRRLLDNREIVEVNGQVRDYLGGLGPAGTEALEEIRTNGSMAAASGIPDEARRRFPIALEVEPRDHLLMQAAFQKHIDAAVSKTINLRADASPAKIKEIFMMAHRLGVKGVTVYRYRSREKQPLSLLDQDVHHPDCRECAL